MIDTTQLIEATRRFTVVLRTAKAVNYRERQIVTTENELCVIGAKKFGLTHQQARRAILDYKNAQKLSRIAA